MTVFPPQVLAYWRRIFEDGTPIAAGDGLSVTVNPSLGRERRAMILEDAGGRARAALTPALAERVGLDRMRAMSTAGLRRGMADAGVTLHDPDVIFYWPSVSPPTRTGGAAHAARRLTEADRRAFDAFQAEASEQDLDDAFVELDHWAVFGTFDGDRLVSAASAYPWDNAPIADIGVLTLPRFRGEGRARAVVLAISRYARDEGYEPQYRCQADNAASVALAEASGFAAFGRWEVAASDGP